MEQVTRLRENVTNCTATLSDMPKPDSPNKQRMEETICKIVDLEREINADIDRLVDLKAEARKAINAVSRSCSAADFGVAVSVLQAVAGDHGGAGAQ